MSTGGGGRYHGKTVSAEPDRAPPATWRLIAVLASSFPLSQAVSRWLYETAVDLHVAAGDSTKVAGDLGEGVIRNLKQEVLLGSIGGPCFEARLACPEGSGLVRFLVTREGLEARSVRDEAARRLTLN